MNISTNIQQLGAGILYSLTREGFRRVKVPWDDGKSEGAEPVAIPVGCRSPKKSVVAPTRRAIYRRRHNHKYYHNTSFCKLQEIFVDLYFFYFMNKIILLISYILVIVIRGKMCYTVITTEEVHANGKVS